MSRINQKGFSLLEVLIAVVLFSIILLSASGAQRQYLKSNHVGEIKSEAAHAAQNVIDLLRQRDVLTMPTTGVDDTRQVLMNSKRTYDVDVAYCTNPTHCTTNEVRQIYVAVYWKDDLIYETETVFTNLGAAASKTPTPSGTVAPTPTATATATPTSTATAYQSSTPTPTPTPKKKKCKWWSC